MTLSFHPRQDTSTDSGVSNSSGFNGATGATEAGTPFMTAVQNKTEMGLIPRKLRSIPMEKVSDTNS
jgi:hypothetical protein